jgi:hypothetical protein
MTYSELAKEIEQLSYRDKFRLAQQLIQLARKEEEEQNPERRLKPGPSPSSTRSWFNMSLIGSGN